ncbi:MAG: hypothetical protein GAK28_00534 [Luteibacter sp.]|uniref:hypothetical protein n=1 Tax=Luteibacter sp. TaxID=1886636 RepID=UPI001385DCB4|nr:hypothetical protein [Luteibacter sp.]KAF1008902.1 MAG: hypothetical protein GAK28_00534 [Luteibacter sp.]
MKVVLPVAVASIVLSLTACRSSEIHLYDAEGYGPNTAEISIKDHAGMVYWRWGTQTFAMKVTLIKDDLVHATIPGGTLELKMADGTRLSFEGTQGRLVCVGCGQLRLPRNWLAKGSD